LKKLIVTRLVQITI